MSENSEYITSKTNIRRKKKPMISKQGVIASLIVVILLILNIAVWAKLEYLEDNLANTQAQINEAIEANERVYNGLLDIQKKQKEITDMQKQYLEQKKEQEKQHSIGISNIKSTVYTTSSDLSNTGMVITSDDMNKIIDYWVFHMGVSSSFKNHGDVFIEASKESGLNPIYILAHAAVESGWGSSYMGRNKHNYFGINCVDSNPGAGYTMGDSVESGIINGAKWIARNFYNNGYTSLAGMKAGNYATDPNWAYNIVTIMNSSRNAL